MTKTEKYRIIMILLKNLNPKILSMYKYTIKNTKAFANYKIMN